METKEEECRTMAREGGQERKVTALEEVMTSLCSHHRVQLLHILQEMASLLPKDEHGAVASRRDVCGTAGTLKSEHGGQCGDDSLCMLSSCASATCVCLCRLGAYALRSVCLCMKSCNGFSCRCVTLGCSCARSRILVCQHTRSSDITHVSCTGSGTHSCCQSPPPPPLSPPPLSPKPQDSVSSHDLDMPILNTHTVNTQPPPLLLHNTHAEQTPVPEPNDKPEHFVDLMDKFTDTLMEASEREWSVHTHSDSIKASDDTHLTEIITTVLHSSNEKDYNLDELFEQHLASEKQYPRTRSQRRQEVMQAISRSPDQPATRRQRLQIKRDLARLENDISRKKKKHQKNHVTHNQSPAMPISQARSVDPHNPHTKNPDMTNSHSQSPDTPNTHAQSPDTPKTLAQSPDTPNTHAQSPDTPSTHAQSPDTPKTLAQSPDTPKTLAQSPDTPKTFAQSPDTPSMHAQSPDTPNTHAQSPDTPNTHAQSPDTPSTHAQSPDTPKTLAQSPDTPNMHAQSPDTPNMHAQSPDTPKTHAQSPDTPNTHAQSPDTPSTHAQSPDTPKTLAQSPDTPKTLAQSPDTPKTLAQSPDTPSTHAQCPDTPNTHAQSPDTPNTHAQSPDTPSTHAHNPDTPIAHAQSPDTPSTHAQSPDTPSTHAQSPDTPSTHAQSPDTPSMHAQSPDTPKSHTQSPDTTELHTQNPDMIELHTQSPDTTELHTQSPDMTELRTLSPDTSRSNTPSPDTTNSHSRSPDTTGSHTLSPDTTGSDTGSPDTTGSDTGSPDTTGSDTGSPDTTGSDTGSPDTTGSDTGSPDTTGSDTGSPDTTGSDTGSPDTTGSDTGSPDTTGSDTGSPDTTGSDTGSPDTTGSDTGSPDTTGSDTGSPDTTGSDTRSPDTTGSDTRSPDKTGSHSRSPDKTGSHSRSPDTTGSHSRSPDTTGSHTRSPDTTGSYSRNPDKTGSYSRNPDKTGSYSRNPDKTGSYSRNPDKTSFCSRSPDKTSSYSRSLDKTGLYSRSPDKTGSYSRSPDKTGSHSRSPDTTGSHTRSPDTTGSYSRSPDKTGSYSRSLDTTGFHTRRPDMTNSHNRSPDMTNLQTQSPETPYSHAQSPNTPNSHHQVQDNPSLNRNESETCIEKPEPCGTVRLRRNIVRPPHLSVYITEPRKMFLTSRRSAKTNTTQETDMTECLSSAVIEQFKTPPVSPNKRKVSKDENNGQSHAETRLRVKTHRSEGLTRSQSPVINDSTNSDDVKYNSPIKLMLVSTTKEDDCVKYTLRAAQPPSDEPFDQCLDTSWAQNTIKEQAKDETKRTESKECRDELSTEESANIVGLRNSIKSANDNETTIKRGPGRPKKLKAPMEKAVKRPIGRPRKSKMVDTNEVSSKATERQRGEDVSSGEDGNKNLKITITYGRRKAHRMVCEGHVLTEQSKGNGALTTSNNGEENVQTVQPQISMNKDQFSLVMPVEDRKNLINSIVCPKQCDRTGTRRPGRPAKVKISGIFVTVTTVSPRQRRIHIKRDAKDPAIQRRSLITELEPNEEQVTIIEETQASVRHSVRERRPSVRFLRCGDMSHSNRPRKLVLNKTNETQQEIQHEFNDATDTKTRPSTSPQDAVHVSTASVESLFNAHLQWWPAKASPEKLKEELNRRLKVMKETWVSDMPDVMTSDENNSAPCSSAVRTLFERDCNMETLCSWFMQTTETQSLAIVKKANNRNPCELFQYDSIHASDRPNICSSPQAERLKKCVKKFATVVPKSRMILRRAQAKTQNSFTKQLSLNMTHKDSEKSQQSGAWHLYRTALDRARSRFKSKTKNTNVDYTSLNEQQVTGVEPLSMSENDLLNVVQRKSCRTSPQQEQLTANAWSTHTLRECKVFLRKLNSANTPTLSEESNDCMMSFSILPDERGAERHQERNHRKSIKVEKRSNSGTSTQQQGKRNRKHRHFSTNVVPPSPKRQRSNRGVMAAKWSDFILGSAR